MSAIEPQNYEAVPLGEKFAWVHGQPGMRAVEAAADSVRTMGRRLGDITTEAGRAMRDLGVSWAGPASDAALRSSQQIVDRAADTRSLADNGADRILDYGHSFDEMRTRVAFEDPSRLSWVETALEPGRYAWDLRPWADGEDHVSLLARNQDHDAAANDALRRHESNARAADDRFVTDGADPNAPPIGAAAIGSGSGSSGAGPPGTGAGGSSTAPSSVSAAAAAPPVTAPVAPSPTATAPAAGAAPPVPGAVPVPGASGAGPGSGGGTRPGAGGAAGPEPEGSAAGAGTGGAAAGTGSRGLAGGTGPGGPAGGTGAAGTTTGAAGAGGLADPAQERIRRGEQFGRDLAAGSPGAGAGTGAGAIAGGTGGRFGSAGRPGGGNGAGSPIRPGSGWRPSGSDGRTPSAGGFGARPGSGAGAWHGGGIGGLGGPAGPRGVGGPGEPTSRLPGETGPRTWSRTPGGPADGALGRPAAGEPAVTGRGAGYGPGYAPMMGGAGGLRSDGDAHRNRYLLPTSEPFDVDLPHAPPVLAPEEDG